LNNYLNVVLIIISIIIHSR